jgi:hypothetical protein
MFFVSCLNGTIFDASYPSDLLFVGTLLNILSLFLTRLSITYWQLFLVQGTAVGICFSCIYLPALALVSIHLKKHRALAMGIPHLEAELVRHPPETV